MAVIHHKLPRGSAHIGQYGVKRQGVGRELRQVAARSGKIVLDAARKGYTKHHEKHQYR